MRSIVILLFIALAGVGLGGITAWYSIQQSHGIGAINVGPWTAFPFAGADEIDPYTVARAVANGTVPLGATEGLAFESITDSAGEALQLDCNYRIEGITPPSKLWTLVAYDRQGFRVKPALGGMSAKYSGAIVRFTDGSFLISVSSRPKPGNWLALRGLGTFRLVLRLYDTPITSNTGLLAPSMPAIIKGECRR